MPSTTQGRARLAGIATVLSLVACYGTLGVIAALSALGIAIALNEAIWAGAIVAFAALATGGLALGLRRHRTPWPLLTGLLGMLTLAYTMYLNYSRTIEIIGFALLIAAAVWDRKISRRHSQALQG